MGSSVSRFLYYPGYVKQHSQTLNFPLVGLQFSQQNVGWGEDHTGFPQEITLIITLLKIQVGIIKRLRKVYLMFFSIIMILTAINK